MVKFCVNCSNLYNHVINDVGIFSYNCQICGHVDDEIDECIVVNEIDSNSRDYQLNQNMIHDNTLPRTRNIKCPNCKDNKEIIIFQYNPGMLNVGYMCTHCKNYWKN